MIFLELKYRWRSVKVTKHGTIRLVRHGFLLMCYTVTLSVFEIYDFKNAVTLNTGA